MRLAIIVLLVASVRLAHADQPWEQGVSAADQTKANQLFAEANQLFARDAHAPALAKYRAAIAIWDHPLIRYNMAVTLIRLDRVLEAAENLDAALRFDAAPFTGDTYRQALDYQRLVRGRVGFIRARCNITGARITLDGKDWVSCPANAAQRVLSGEHLIVGERPGYQTLSRRVLVTGGQTQTPSLDFVPSGGRRAWYQRWYVLGAASVLVLGASGAAVYYATRDDGTLGVHGTTR
jgi:hypothetical protein